MIEQTFEADYQQTVGRFNAEEFVVWTTGPDEFGRYTASTLSTQDRRLPEPGPTGIGNTPADATLDAWQHFERNRGAFGR